MGIFTLEFKKISTVIFDLGGVIVDVDINRTIQEFSTLSGFSYEEVKRLQHSQTAFFQFEKGNIDSAGFRTAIRTIFNAKPVSDNAIDKAWNAMITGLPKIKLDLMQRLKEIFQVFILSNTNTIHVDFLNRVMIPAVTETNSLKPFAHKVYYSHEMGMRKPDDEIYHHVLNSNNLNPEEILFLDDNPENIEAANRIGIQVKQILHPDNVLEVFHSI